MKSTKTKLPELSENQRFQIALLEAQEAAKKLVEKVWLAEMEMEAKEKGKCNHPPRFR